MEKGTADTRFDARKIVKENDCGRRKRKLHGQWKSGRKKKGKKQYA